jgi:Ran-binding protein 9/10
MPSSLVATGVQFPDNTIQTTAATGGVTFTVRSANYTAVAGDSILANTSGGSFTITLPSSPSTGAVITIEDSAQTFNTNPLLVARNGNTIMGLAEDMWASINGAFFTLIYNGSTWRIA